MIDIEEQIGLVKYLNPLFYSRDTRMAMHKIIIQRIDGAISAMGKFRYYYKPRYGHYFISRKTRNKQRRKYFKRG